MRNSLISSSAVALSLLAFASPCLAEQSILRAGTKAPDIALSILHGRLANIHGMKGKVVLLDFWATWCGTCRLATPFLQSVHKQFGARGLQVIGVSVDDPTTFDQIGPLIKSSGVSYMTATVSAPGQVERSYGFPAPPALFLIDRRGVVRWSCLGYDPADNAVLIRRIKALLSEEPGNQHPLNKK